jgi:tetratricopeptide (TPR) repeat protein
VPTAICAYRVFLASPGGLEAERRAFRDILNQYNEDEALQRGALFVPVGWETTLAGMGRPQALIDQELRTADYFVLLLCDRWGTPPSAQGCLSSGTEEEYEIAKACFADTHHQLRQLVVFFKAVEPSKLNDPGPQLRKVLEFRTRLEADRSLLFASFDEVSAFQRHLRRTLAVWLRDHEANRLGKAGGTADLLPGSQQTPEVMLRYQGDLSISSLLEEAESLSAAGRLTEAEVAYSRAIAKGNVPEAFNRYGSFLVRVGRLLQAEELFTRVLQLTTPEREGWSKAHLNLGWIRQLRGNVEGARIHYEQAISADEQFGRLSGLSRDYYSLGALLEIQDRLNEAEQMHRRSLEISQQIGSMEGVVKAFNGLGIIQEKRGDLDVAEKEYSKALENGERFNLQDDIANSLANLAAIYEEKGMFDAAQAALRKALAIHERLGRLEGMARVYHGLGSVYEAQGDVTNAQQQYEKALELNERLDQMEGIAANCCNLAGVYHALQRFDRAEQMLQRSLQINERLGHMQGVATDYGNLAEVCAAQGRYTAAASLLSRAREIFTELGLNESLSWIENLSTEVGTAERSTAVAKQVCDHSSSP